MKNGDKWMPNHLLYQINKFKKENGDKWMPVHVSIASIIIINSKRYLETK